MLLSLGAASAFSDSLKAEKNNETNTMEFNGGTNGAFNKLIVIDRVIDCPHCGFPTTIYKTDTVHYCERCGRDINSPVEKYKEVPCPWCNAISKMRESVNPKDVKCYSCCNYLTSTTEITLCAFYSYKANTTPLIGNKANLYLSLSTGGEKFIATTYSNENGVVSFTFNRNDVLDKNIRERNFFVRIFPGDDNVKVAYNNKESIPEESYQRIKEYRSVENIIGDDYYYPCVETMNNTFIMVGKMFLRMLILL